MQLLNKEDVNIVSLEDPVEYFIDGLNQSQVRPEIGYDFASGLRQILRQDPDVILVGEIRDTETAGLSVHAALTGHIVLSTLHTNNSLGVIPRLIDMKVEPFLLPSSLNLMVAQRLLPRLCEKCREAIEAPPEISAVIKREIDFLPQEALADLKERVDNINGPYIIYRSRGCEGCRGKGVVGRLAIFEVLTMTRELEDIIVHEPTEAKILAEARRQGIISLRQDGIIKALSGFFSIEEVLKETTEL
jgi:type IV pilus assembly protein PilB